MNKPSTLCMPHAHPDARPHAIPNAAHIGQDTEELAANSVLTAAPDLQRPTLPQVLRLSILTPSLKEVADAIAMAFLFLVVAFNGLLWLGVQLHPERDDIAPLAYISSSIGILLWWGLHLALLRLFRLRISIAVIEDSIAVTWFGIYRRKFPRGQFKLVDIDDELGPAGWHQPERVRIIMATGAEDVTLLTVHGAKRAAELLMRLSDLETHHDTSSQIKEGSAQCP